MRCRFMQIFLFRVMILVANAQNVRGQNKWTVTGRIVDNCGKPVSDARIFTFPAGPVIGTRFDNEVADADGRFRYERESSVPGESETFLYITTPFPPNAHISGNFVPPFYAIRHVDRSFAGRAIRVKTNAELNLGDVPIQVYYGVVIVYLKNRKGEPMFTDAEDWEYIGIRIRDLQGKVVDERYFPPASVKEAVRENGAAIALALPEGAWRIEIAPDGLQQKWPYKPKGKVLSSEMFLLKVSNSPLEITLRAGSKK